MALNLKVLAVAALALATVTASAHNESINSDLQGFDSNYFTVAKIKVREITPDALGNEMSQLIVEKSFNQEVKVDPIDQAGKVIGVAKDLVAFGEDVYRLVIKGKPTNQTKYAPISVVPKINGEPVDPLDVENTRLPVKKTYQVVYENLYGADVVTFRYSIMWAYGGTYDGKGAYLSHVQIIPEYARTLFGYDFTATMKLGGIQNIGTRTNPIAAATVLLEYTVSTVMVANNETASYVVTGAGGFKAY